MIDPACLKREQELGRNGEHCSYETPSFILSLPCAPFLPAYQDGKCPLMVAFRKKLFEIVQLLIAAGANVNVSDEVSST